MAEVIEGALEAGGAVVVGGEEARHAVRVKRLEPGEVVELIDGRGSVAAASYDSAEKLGKKGGWTVRLIVDSVERVEPARPAVEVLAAVPKGGRLEEMVDQLAQVGAASWSPLVTKRSGPPPRDGKRERLERIAAESAKQCGRAWDMGIGDPVELARATEPSVRTLV